MGVFGANTLPLPFPYKFFCGGTIYPLKKLSGQNQVIALEINSEALLRMVIICCSKDAVTNKVICDPNHLQSNILMPLPLDSSYL